MSLIFSLSSAILMDTLVGTAVERDTLKAALRSEDFAKALN